MIISSLSHSLLISPSFAHMCCMTSSVDDIITFDSTHDKTTSGVVYHHRPWITKQDQTISGVACHHCPWIAKLDMTPSGVAYHHGQWAIYTVRRHWSWQCHHRPWNVHMVEWFRAWHAIIVLGKIHDQTTSGKACYHFPSKTHTTGRRAAWNVRMELRQHTRSDDVRRCML